MIAGSALWLALTGNTGIRYSADHDGTVPMWFRWIPALVGIVLVRLAPPNAHRSPSDTRARASMGRVPGFEATVLLAAAVLFAVTLRLAGGGEPAHTLLKLPLLLAVPAVMFGVVRHRRGAWTPPREKSGPWRRYGPTAPVVAWLALSYASPLATPPSDYALTVDLATLIVTVAVVFLINSLLEEVFYRRWLQTRWESILGRWPAIVLTALLWAVWHIGIHSTGRLDVDLASVFVSQGVQGLFLGYLWSKYRMMWPILVVHGAINAVPIMVPLL